MGDDEVVAEECVRFQMSYTGNWLVYRLTDSGNVGMTGYITNKGTWCQIVPWHFVCNETHARLTVEQLRAIADRVDELNGEDAMRKPKVTGVCMQPTV